MVAQRTRDTGTELALRSALHAVGLRFRVHQRPLPAVRRVADVVFRRAQVAVYVDGCFWHGCPAHATWPKANADFWKRKLMANQRRDASTDSALADAGWVAVRVWEHEDPREAAGRVEAVVRARLSASAPP
jgi:DNA mismatch endonuclease, patch repair protein